LIDNLLFIFPTAR